MAHGIELLNLYNRTEALKWPTPAPWILIEDTPRPNIYAETLPSDGVVLLGVDHAISEETLFVIAHERVHIHLGNSLRQQLLGKDGQELLGTYHELLKDQKITGPALRALDATDKVDGHYKDDIANWYDPASLSISGIAAYIKKYFDGIKSGKIRGRTDFMPIDISMLNYPDSSTRIYTPVSPVEEHELFLSAMRTGCEIMNQALDRHRNSIAPAHMLHIAEEALANWAAAALLGLTINDVAAFKRQDEPKIIASKAIEAHLRNTDPTEVLAEITNYEDLATLTDKIK